MSATLLYATARLAKNIRKFPNKPGTWIVKAGNCRICDDGKSCLIHDMRLAGSSLWAQLRLVYTGVEVDGDILSFQASVDETSCDQPVAFITGKVGEKIQQFY